MKDGPRPAGFYRHCRPAADWPYFPTQTAVKPNRAKGIMATEFGNASCGYYDDCTWRRNNGFTWKKCLSLGSNLEPYWRIVRSFACTTQGDMNTWSKLAEPVRPYLPIVTAVTIQINMISPNLSESGPPRLPPSFFNKQSPPSPDDKTAAMNKITNFSIAAIMNSQSRSRCEAEDEDEELEAKRRKLAEAVPALGKQIHILPDLYFIMVPRNTFFYLYNMGP